jgi:hypothetical protein
LEELDSLKVETKECILQYKEVASQTIEKIDQVEAERMEKVPRLYSNNKSHYMPRQLESNGISMKNIF